MIDNSKIKLDPSRSDKYCEKCNLVFGNTYTSCPRCGSFDFHLLATNRPSGSIPIENINIQPSYYKGRLVMDIINQFDLSFCLGNVVKYVLRNREKGGIEDLKKAKWYLEEEIRILESEKGKGSV